jgi:hypothetical protein
MLVYSWKMLVTEERANKQNTRVQNTKKYPRVKVNCGDAAHANGALVVMQPQRALKTCRLHKP